MILLYLSYFFDGRHLLLNFGYFPNQPKKENQLNKRIRLSHKNKRKVHENVFCVCFLDELNHTAQN